MSSYTRLTRTCLAVARPRVQLVQQRQYTPTTRLLVRQTGQTPEETEQKKQEQLKKQEQGKGEWNESLASSSESQVKADREEVKDHDEHIEKLQKETAGQAEKEKR